MALERRSRCPILLAGAGDIGVDDLGARPSGSSSANGVRRAQHRGRSPRVSRGERGEPFGRSAKHGARGARPPRRAPVRHPPDPVSHPRPPRPRGHTEPRGRSRAYPCQSVCGRSSAARASAKPRGGSGGTFQTARPAEWSPLAFEPRDHVQDPDRPRPAPPHLLRWVGGGSEVVRGVPGGWALRSPRRSAIRATSSKNVSHAPRRQRATARQSSSELRGRRRERRIDPSVRVALGRSRCRPTWYAPRRRHRVDVAELDGVGERPCKIEPVASRLHGQQPRSWKNWPTPSSAADARSGLPRRRPSLRPPLPIPGPRAPLPPCRDPRPTRQARTPSR